jgi:DUF2075 family protein
VTAGLIEAIYTAPGFEYDCAGVIFDPDLVYTSADGRVGQPSHFHPASSRVTPTASEFAAPVKNAYRVRLTRRLKGCEVEIPDQQTSAYVLSRIDRSVV